jgi:hypothetical protein
MLASNGGTTLSRAILRFSRLSRAATPSKRVFCIELVVDAAPAEDLAAFTAAFTSASRARSIAALAVVIRSYAAAMSP